MAFHFQLTRRLDANFPLASDHDTPTKNGSASQEEELREDLDWEGAPGRNGVESNGATPTARRAEDPLEAIDALEDAIEEVDQSLPTVAEHNSHNNSTRSSSVSHEPEATHTPVKAANNGGTAKRNSVTAKTPASSTKRYSRATPNNAGHARVGSRTDSGLRKNSPTKASNNNDENQPPEGSSTKLAIHKPAFVPAKSSKPATRPTFELPGEAISRRKREQIEERRRKEEEELQQRRTFKAGGVKYDSARPAGVRETASSRARTNRTSQVINPQTMTTPQRKLSTPSSAGRRDSGAAGASVDGENGGSLARAQASSTSSPSTRRSSSGTAPSVKSPTAKATPGGSSTATTTKQGGAVQTTKGKEIFRRERAERDERQEREEAAKRSRAEAADRSRQLGRAFAERQRQKKQPEASGTKP